MPLIIENGSGVADAESYISVEDADAYFAARAIEAWDGVEDKEAALRRATDYMNARYTGRWKGYRATATQALDWPRRDAPLKDTEEWFGFVPTDAVPIEVKRACAELALLANGRELMPTLERAESTVQVGPVLVHFDDSSPINPRFPSIDAMLSPYLTGSSFTARLART